MRWCAGCAHFSRCFHCRKESSRWKSSSHQGASHCIATAPARRDRQFVSTGTLAKHVASDRRLDVWFRVSVWGSHITFGHKTTTTNETRGPLPIRLKNPHQGSPGLARALGCHRRRGPSPHSPALAGLPQPSCARHDRHPASANLHREGFRLIY